jgi:hypothetical protein
MVPVVSQLPIDHVVASMLSQDFPAALAASFVQLRSWSMDFHTTTLH